MLSPTARSTASKGTLTRAGILALMPCSSTTGPVPLNAPAVVEPLTSLMREALVACISRSGARVRSSLRALVAPSCRLISQWLVGFTWVCRSASTIRRKPVLLKAPLCSAKRQTPSVRPVKGDRPRTTMSPLTVSWVMPVTSSSSWLLPLGSRSISQRLPASSVSVLSKRKVPAPEVPASDWPGLNTPPERTVTAPEVCPVPASMAPVLMVVAVAASVPCKSSTPPLTVVAPVWLWLPCSTNTPLPALIRPPVPPMAPLYRVELWLPPTVRKPVPKVTLPEPASEPTR